MKLLLTGTFQEGSQVPYCVPHPCRKPRTVAAQSHYWQPPELKALGIYDMIFHPSASCICLFICSITVQVMYCIQLLLPLLLAHSLHTPPISRPICLGLFYSLICPSVHSSLSIPPSINLASRLLSCTPPLRPSAPPSICLSGLCKGQRRREI